MDSIRPFTHAPSNSSFMAPAAADEPSMPRDLAQLSDGERQFVEKAVADSKFGPKNAFILSRYFGYPVHRDPDAGAFVPPPPNMAAAGTVTTDPAVIAKSRTFDEIIADTSAAGPIVSIQLPGMSHAVDVIGVSPREANLVRDIFEAVPPWSRGFLQTVKQICVANFEAYKAPDGSASDKTSGVAEANTGRLLLNRKFLDFNTRHVAADADDATRAQARRTDDEHWQNTLLHELAHFHDRWLQTGDDLPSRDRSTPLGNHGVWYTNYAWLVQDTAEDMAEGYAILGVERLKAVHPDPTLH